MRLTGKAVDQVVAELAGERVVPLVCLLRRRKQLSEIVLAQYMKSEINEVRGLLYRLHNSNLVSFVKKKDKKKGWYVYYWTFNDKRMRFLVEKSKERRLKTLERMLSLEESERFFSCGNGCMRLDFEKTIDLRFQCPECGSILQQDENSGRVSSLKEEIQRIAAELKG